MELDTTTQRPRELSKETKARYRRDKLCFSCGRSGHQAKDCRVGKPKSGAPWKRKQFNATYQGPMQVNATQRSLPTSTSTFTDGPSTQWNPANDLRSRNVDSWADTEPWELLDNAETPPATPEVQVLEDFAKPDHPRHRTLHWRACYTVYCPYH